MKGALKWLDNGTLPDRSEVDPDMRGGKTFATEREGGVMSLFYDLSQRAIFWVYWRVIAFRPGMRSCAQRNEARGLISCLSQLGSVAQLVERLTSPSQNFGPGFDPSASKLSERDD